MPVTRIRNNQVYNSDIDAATKLVAGSITGALWVNPLTYTGNLTVGNLTVNGQTTSLDSVNIVAADPLIVLNRNTTGTPTYDLGMVLGRGNQTSAAFIWNEASSQFATIYTTESLVGATTGTINNSGYANLRTGLSTANSYTTLFGGQLTGYHTGPIGANTANSGVFTSVTTVSGGQLTGYHTGPIGANTANSGVFTSLTVNNDAIITGNLDVTGTSTFRNYEYVLSTEYANNLVANGGIASTNYTTGSLIVTGGAGISGNLYVNSWLNGTSGFGGPTHAADTISPYSTSNVNFKMPLNGNVVINSDSLVANLIVHGNGATYKNLLVTNSSTGQVGIKISPELIQPAVSFQINATDTMLLPVGSTGQRPTVGQVTKGMFRFNNTLNVVEFWDGTAWNTGGATFTVVSSDQFTGTGSQVNFTLSQSATTASLIVAINGVIQIPTTAYSVSGTTLIFTEAPLTSDIIDARTIVTTVATLSIADGTTSITVGNTANYIAQAIRGSNIAVATSSIYTFNIPVTGYLNGALGANTANTAAVTTLTTTGTATFNSTSGVTAIANGGTSGVGNIGATGATFNTVFAKATTAQYADLAECYAGDADYDAGTVLEFGGDNEVTISNIDGSLFVAGVVSTNPAHLMNSAIEADYPISVALTGRVPTKVIGPITKGQMMVSAGNGKARAEANPVLGSVIGKAVENFGLGEGIIEVVVGRI
jgi:hypothetical protein